MARPCLFTLLVIAPIGKQQTGEIYISNKERTNKKVDLRPIIKTGNHIHLMGSRRLLSPLTAGPLKTKNKTDCTEKMKSTFRSAREINK